jgi:dihydroorotase
MQLYHSGRMPLSDVIERLTVAPAKLIHLDRGSLGVGAVADVTVFDPDAEWVFRREDTASKAVNNPFYDWTLKGRNVMTIVAGEIAWQ